MTRFSARRLIIRQNGFTLGPVDLDVGAGEAVAVIGRSGAGKTTLLRGLSGLVPLTSGAVDRSGSDLGAVPPERRRSVYVPQGLGLFPHQTAEENVAFSVALRRSNGHRAERVRELVDRFGVRPFARRTPDRLSEGEKQRVAVARALAAEPELLLWDEPLVSLDVGARDELLTLLADVRAREGLPIAFVTHDAQVAFSLANRFLLLDAGRPLFYGSPEALVDRPPTMFAARFVGYQNLLDPRALAGRAPGTFGSWLCDRSGPEGVGFPVLSVDPDGPWSAVVRRREPAPGDVRLWGDADGVVLRLSSVPVAGRSPAVGDQVRFSLSESEVRALGTADTAVRSAG